MTRYFFDVNAQGSLRYDFSGCWLPRPDQAQEMAELIAMDLACLEVNQSFPTEVQVRDAAGQQLFSVPVKKTAAVVA